jgi:hypothetical protein
MGWLTRAIDAGKEHRNPLEDVAGGLLAELREESRKIAQL